jgi:hypothetical protein
VLWPKRAAAIAEATAKAATAADNKAETIQ